LNIFKFLYSLHYSDAAEGGLIGDAYENYNIQLPNILSAGPISNYDHNVPNFNPFQAGNDQ